MSMKLVYHDMYSRHFDSLTEVDRSRINAVIRSIDLASGEPKSTHPILPVGRDYSILATPEIRLMFRPENGELHLLGLISQSFIDELNRKSQLTEDPVKRSIPKSRTIQKTPPTRKMEPHE